MKVSSMNKRKIRGGGLTLSIVSYFLLQLGKKNKSALRETENQNKNLYVTSLHNLGRANRNTCEWQRTKSL